MTPTFHVEFWHKQCQVFPGTMTPECPRYGPFIVFSVYPGETKMLCNAPWMAPLNQGDFHLSVVLLHAPDRVDRKKSLQWNIWKEIQPKWPGAGCVVDWFPDRPLVALDIYTVAPPPVRLGCKCGVSLWNINIPIKVTRKAWKGSSNNSTVSGRDRKQQHEQQQ